MAVNDALRLNPAGFTSIDGIVVKVRDAAVTVLTLQPVPGKVRHELVGAAREPQRAHVLVELGWCPRAPASV